MNILTKELIRKSEESTVESGAFSFRQLMYIAGTKAAELINEKIDCKNKKIAVICGKGNNGGDGFVIADYLYGMGAEISVVTPFGEPETYDAKYYYRKLEYIEKSCVFDNNIPYDIIIDAIFGIGYCVRENEEVKCIFEDINTHSAYKIAVDIPSGVEANSGKIGINVIKADYTVTFIALKPCFVLPDGSDYCGEVSVADIGVKPIDSEYLVIEKPEFPKRRHNSHKGSYGTALIIAGSYGMAGAAILSSKAALRSGLGIAKCLLCEGIYPPFTAALPEAVCVPSKQTKTGVLDSSTVDIGELSDNATAILFGCGVGKGKDIEKILQNIISNSKIPIVIDADGINALCGCIDILKKAKAPLVITPHPGEMARLCGKSVKEVEADRVNIARSFALKYNCIVVLKGANTIVVDTKGNIFFNTTGNAGMATGGSGDVLSGIIVSLLAQGYSPLFSAKSAVYLHGAAGDRVAKKRSLHSLLPGDIIEEL